MYYPKESSPADLREAHREKMRNKAHRRDRWYAEFTRHHLKYRTANPQHKGARESARRRRQMGIDTPTPAL